MTEHAALPILSDDQTAAGNYFISNYTPFSLWTPQRAIEAQTRVQTAGDDATPLGLYIHIPFCRKRCHFCYFKVYTDKNKDDIRRYLDAVIAEMQQYAQTPFVSGRELTFIYFGGGTPSYLSDKQLAYLVQGLTRARPWHTAEEIAFECEPGTLHEKKLRAIRDLGVTRLSLGVENFDDEILELNNRAHRSKQVHQAYGWALAAGFEQINIDLIAGMVGETDANWQRCVEQTVEWAPDCVTIYQMEIPYNTTIYRRMQDEGRTAAPVADWKTKRRWVSEAFAELERAGYTVGSAYTAVKDAARTRFVYRDALWDGADMLGVGVSSFGQLAGVHYQNQHEFASYLSAVEAGTLPIYRAMTMTEEEKMIRQFILRLKLGRLSKKPFLDRFGIDVFERFASILRGYEQQGYLKLGEDELVLSREGLLRVDSLLHAFFLPEHRGVRYA